ETGLNLHFPFPARQPSNRFDTPRIDDDYIGNATAAQSADAIVPECPLIVPADRRGSVFICLRGGSLGAVHAAFPYCLRRQRVYRIAAECAARNNPYQ